MKNAMKKIFALILAISVICLMTVGLCACDEKDGAYTFSSDLKLYLDPDQTILMDETVTDFMPMILGAALDQDDKKAYVEFKKDGTVHFEMSTKARLVETAQGLLDFFNINMSSLTNMDLAGSIDNMVDPMFPGFGEKFRDGDLDGCLMLIKHSLGFYISGLDYEDETVAALIAEIAQNMRLPSDILERLPKDLVLTLSFDSTYVVRDLLGTDGKIYTQIGISHVANSDATEPWAVFTLTSGKNGKKAVIRAEFMNLQLTFLENLPERE